MTALERLRQRVTAESGLLPLKVLCGAGALGFGIPESSLRAGFERSPHFVGCDMGSIDPGPYYLGTGRMAAPPATARRDLELVLLGARAADIPLLIGTAGTAGSRLQVEEVVTMLREIAEQHGLHFTLATIDAELDASLILQAIDDGRVLPISGMPALEPADVTASRVVVGQMGVEPFQRALLAGADVVIAGRACDTAIFAAIPMMLGYPIASSVHMAKIIECSSLCCVPGGRDAILGILEGESFVLESMHPDRKVTPISAAAHSLYEESDPYVIREPDGVVRLNDVRFESIDERRVRGSGARWEPARRPTVKIEGACYEGERSVLLAATADPGVIGNIDPLLAGVEAYARSLLPEEVHGSYRLMFRRYGLDGVTAWPAPPAVPPRELFVLGECIAESADTATAVVTLVRQNLLHLGFPGRLCTGGNLAFPFSPPEVQVGSAWRFCVYHIMQVDELAPLFPVTLHQL